jgi:hypothetical protein
MIKDLRDRAEVMARVVGGDLDKEYVRLLELEIDTLKSITEAAHKKIADTLNACKAMALLAKPDSTAGRDCMKIHGLLTTILTSDEMMAAKRIQDDRMGAIRFRKSIDALLTEHGLTGCHVLTDHEVLVALRKLVLEKGGSNANAEDSSDSA